MSNALILQKSPGQTSGTRIKRWILAGAVLVFAVHPVHGQTGAVDQGNKSEASIRAQLVGAWRLVSRQSRRVDGKVEDDPGLSATPMGILIYDQSGHVAAQLSRRDRTVAMVGEECQLAATTKGTTDTAQTVLGYDAYFGSYKVNARDHIVTHHLEAALWPGDIGKDIDRHFEISGDELTITFKTTTRDGVKVTRTLIWKRMN
jgi:hypothetical protein